MRTLAELNGTTWAGESELWLDPLGDEATRSECRVTVAADAIRWAWRHEGEPKRGALTLDAAPIFTDDFHSPEPMECTRDEASWALVSAFGTYAAGEGPRWGWRVTLCLRPLPGGPQLVLQMTHVAPWGEEARAVRMVCRREE